MKLNLRDSPRGVVPQKPRGGKPELTPRGEPKEWRKSALMTVLGLALFSSFLRWRHVLANDIWLVALASSGLLAICALVQPHWFRGYHRWSMRIGFAVSRFFGRILLTLFFFLVLTPVGLMLRLTGKDALQLKPPRRATTYWQAAREYSPLDRLF